MIQLVIFILGIILGSMLTVLILCMFLLNAKNEIEP